MKEQVIKSSMEGYASSLFPKLSRRSEDTLDQVGACQHVDTIAFKGAAHESTSAGFHEVHDADSDVLAMAGKRRCIGALAELLLRFLNEIDDGVTCIMLSGDLSLDPSAGALHIGALKGLRKWVICTVIFG